MRIQLPCVSLRRCRVIGNGIGYNLDVESQDNPTREAVRQKLTLEARFALHSSGRTPVGKSKMTIMPRTLQQSVVLPAAAERLYEMYLDPVAHGQFTEAPVVISGQSGSPFRAFDGKLSGTMLQTVPKRLIVQAWRSLHWRPDDLDSTLILSFWPETESTGRIELIHVNIVDHDFEGVTQGWERHYWTPWRNFLIGERGGKQR